MITVRLPWHAAPRFAPRALARTHAVHRTPPRTTTETTETKTTPRASLSSFHLKPQAAPRCPLPQPHAAPVDPQRLAVQWYVRRISDAIDAGNLADMERGLDSLGHVDLIRRALCINALDRDGLTWLMRAARAGNLYMLQALIHCGAEPQIRDIAGLTAGDWAHLHGQHHLAPYLQAVDAAARLTHLPLAALAYLAIHTAHPALLHVLLGRRIHTRAVQHTHHPKDGPAPTCTHRLTDSAGRFTPLTAVAHTDPNERAIEIILEHMDATDAGAHTTQEGDPAVVLAAFSEGNAAEAIHQMLHRGANVHARSREGWSLAHLIAAYSSHPTAGLRVLLDHQGNLHATTQDGWTPLHFLLARGDFPQAVALLLQAGANPQQATRPPNAALGVTAEGLARHYKREKSLACMI